MKQIIKGRLYNTESAQYLGGYSCNSRRDFAFYEEDLYRKKTGEFFLYGSGGPASKYAEAVGMNTWSGSCRIIPMTEAEARNWAEDHLTAEEYIGIFGEVDE